MNKTYLKKINIIFIIYFFSILSCSSGSSNSESVSPYSPSTPIPTPPTPTPPTPTPPTPTPPTPPLYSLQWVWMGGSNKRNIGGTYGTKGTPASANIPGARADAVSWIDSSGNFWVFGGGGWGAQQAGNGGFLNDLWKYSHTTKQWTWIGGSDGVDQSGTLGTKGTPAITNIPGSRLGITGWLDSSGNFWLFGGRGWNSTGGMGYLNTLWKFNPTTLQWTWVSGVDGLNQKGTYGTKNSASASNSPGARAHAVSWTDKSGNLWLFGGYGYDSTGNTLAYLNDLWKFNPTTSQWTWISGSNLVDQNGIYGTKGTPASNNTPGARENPAGWVDSSDNLWLFGGLGYTFGVLNDLWKFNTTTSQWTWIGGSTSTNQIGVYGTKGTPASTNIPSSRYMSVSWVDGSNNLWLFGGKGTTTTTSQGSLNDLWKYDITTSQWTWISGSNAINQRGVYGTLETPATTNVPGGRYYPVSWVDGSNNLWLFGGFGYDSAGSEGSTNDLWKFILN